MIEERQSEVTDNSDVTTAGVANTMDGILMTNNPFFRPPQRTQEKEGVKAQISNASASKEGVRWLKEWLVTENLDSTKK